jgi:hypothetical protein
MSTPFEQVELTADQKCRIAEAADRLGQPWRDVLERALRQVPAGAGQPDRPPAKKSFYDALNEDGVIGILDDAPEDLSTNPAYMEGFGRD